MSKFIEALRVAAQARAEKDAAWLSCQWAKLEQRAERLRRVRIAESLIGNQGKWARA